MRNSIGAWALLPVLLLSAEWTGTAAAQSRASRAVAPAALAATPLTLDEVLASSRFHAPQVLEALARVRGAEGKLLTAEGAFDTVFSAGADQRLAGFYDGGEVGAMVTRPLENFGGSVYGGYRVSRGTFPIYENENYTSEGGELKAGAVFSLLRDRMIDERRFARVQAEADIALADADRMMVAVGVQTRAIQTYNAWVVAGLRLKVYRGLLALAQERQAGFKRQVDEGARSRIILTENEQNILRRETLVAQSEQALAMAANALSLYLRDADGRPLVVEPTRLPDGFGDPLRRPARPDAMIAARPDLRALDIRLRQASQRIALDRNSLLPRLDLKVEASNDFGPAGAGGTSFNGFDTKVGLSFSVPLEQRGARGRIAQTNAEIDAFKQRRRFLEDQIETDIAALGIAVDNASRLVMLAANEAARANDMAVAERRRFSAGASDFFLVNVREESAADAEVRRIDAAFRQIVAHADLAAATADLDALGL
jgi:outer membrane protein TolC